jgi:hypothetical protein
MSRADLKRLVEDAVQSRLLALESEPYSRLAERPDHFGEGVEGTQAQLSTYCEAIEGGRLRIVVQGVLPDRLGFSNFIVARGFILDPGGVPISLKEEALWDFT